MPEHMTGCQLSKDDVRILLEAECRMLERESKRLEDELLVLVMRHEKARMRLSEVM